LTLELKKDISSAVTVCPPCKKSKTSTTTTNFNVNLVTCAQKILAKLSYYGPHGIGINGNELVDKAAKLAGRAVPYNYTWSATGQLEKTSKRYCPTSNWKTDINNSATESCNRWEFAILTRLKTGPTHFTRKDILNGERRPSYILDIIYIILYTR